MEAIQAGQKILFEFGKTGRPNLETILETMRKEGWPKRECHYGRETRSPTKAEGELSLLLEEILLLKRGKGYNPSLLGPWSSVLRVTWSFT